MTNIIRPLYHNIFKKLQVNPQLVKRLGVLENKALKKYFIERKSIVQVAKEMNISFYRVRQLLSKGAGKIQASEGNTGVD